MKIFKDNGALRITFLYVLFAGLWISLSDILLGILITDPQLMARLGLFKGWIFIIITASALYTLMSRELGLRYKAEASLQRQLAEVEEAEQALQEAVSELQNLDHIVNHSPAVAFLWGPTVEGNVLYVSDNVSQFGYSPQEFLTGGLLYNSIIHPDDVERMVSEAKQYDEDKQTEFFQQYRILTKSGEPRWLDDHTWVLRDADGKTIYCEGIILDVTDRRRAEEEIRKLNAGLEQRVTERTAQLQSALDELETFSHSVSHDLRAPLRHIDGFSQILAEEYSSSLDENGKKLIARISANIQDMSDLIDALFSLSRLSRQEIIYRPVNLAQVAQEVMADLRQQEPARQVEWIVSIPQMVEGDSSLLKIVIDNLLRNAWKFTAKNPHARIEFGSNGQKNGKTIFFVKDNGVGFDMEFVGKLFIPFQRLHGPHEFPGTGIGLTTVKRIIERHGGEVWAEGAVNLGATVYFTL